MSTQQAQQNQIREAQTGLPPELEPPQDSMPAAQNRDGQRHNSAEADPAPMKDRVHNFRNYLQGTMRDEVAKQLPKGVDPDRFIRTAISVVQMQPDLLNCNRSSLLNAVMQAAKDGLLPDGKEATIQSYRTNVAPPNAPKKQWVLLAQYMPMVGGIVKKMYEAGCTYVDAAAVNEKDHFRFARGDDPRIEHDPDMIADDPGKIIAAYAIVKLGTGETKREVMPRRDIEKVRAASKSSNGPGWSKWYDQFAIKAVLKRIYKQIPHESDDLRRIIEHDNDAMGFDFRQQAPQDTTEITGEGMKKLEGNARRPSRLSKILADHNVPETADDTDQGTSGDEQQTQEAADSHEQQ